MHIQPAYSQSRLFQSEQLSPAGEYTFGIEGPAADAAGNLYAVNLGKPGTVGKLTAGATRSQLYAQLPDEGIGNSIRFGSDGQMYVADYKKHRIFVMAGKGAEPQVYFASDKFSQPNDLTVSADSTIYASDPNWKARSGKIWRIDKGGGTVSGTVMTAPRGMGTTNGIDLSPDEKTLYVGESNTGEIWSYTVQQNALTSPRLLIRFEPNTIDGLRTDIDGRLFVARILKGSITILGKDGKFLRDVSLTAKEPTNIAFGGADGMTVYVTQREGGYIESFRTDRPGREFCLQVKKCFQLDR